MTNHPGSHPSSHADADPAQRPAQRYLPVTTSSDTENRQHAPGSLDDVEVLVCGCGCRFRIVPGMRVHLIRGVAYTLGCVGEPVLVTENGPDARSAIDFAAVSAARQP